MAITAGMPCRASACAPPERVVPGAAAALARIQHHQPQRAVAADHQPQVPAGHQPGLVVSGFQGERAILSFLIPATMPNEVQHVVVTKAQGPLQRRKSTGL
jgi:hypothetical protein